ncbi:V-type ATP synthase subunit F [Ostreiculturibacter nitratireducens]|uniref:V-type ATP synthase subunit F n=1 Tax=Ostreiculturibacter nitratireducens TaxID=3075226 RepID=UPI0031B5C6B2
MPEVIFIGDDVTAAGFRLAGVPSFSPDPARLEEVIASEGEDCRMIVMTAEMLSRLPERVARGLLESSYPLLAVVPDARETVAVPDIEAEVRRALGIEV